ncbi:hypothetical protein Clacol_007044 [Clathrus columnatus]|uniref:Uncharacterized protein n=1 Tax=Clathrus columnatus TaxID=1419009 RepID=A0AAV5AI37_9AGAM|nr:hypothetical protein Clacol_007044 [Clathrus columnatus]
MENSNWKKLRRLHLYITLPVTPLEEITEFSMIITAFFDRHPTLESLYTNIFRIPIPALPSSFLPKLCSIGLKNGFISVPSLLSRGIFSRLVHWFRSIKGLDIDTLPQMSNLETLYLPQYLFSSALLPFLRKAPHLKKICLELCASGIDEDYNAQEEIINSLLGCPNLTHIFCDFTVARVQSTERASFHEKVEPFIKGLSTLRNLKYIQLHKYGEKVFVELERNEDELYSGYHFVTLKEAGGYPELWGNFFFRV